MTKETELKLRLNPDDVPALAAFLDANARPDGHSTLKNWYLDTPDARLVAARAVLRIREHAGGYEQTLKTRGSSQAGLQIRGEWNWPVAGPAIETTPLNSSDVAGHWPPNIDISTLGEVFTTHFERHSWLWQQDDCTAEVVIDRGEIAAAGAAVPLCEVELELKQGTAAGLWQQAIQLAQQAPLWLSDVSKAERGYRLARLGRSWQPLPQLTDEQDLATALPALLDYEFLNLKRALEACLWDNDLSGALRARNHWLALRGLPRLAGKVLKRRQTRELRAALDVWEAPLQKLALLAQLTRYLNGADDANAVAAELKAVHTLWKQQVRSIRNSKELAVALLQAASELYHLPRDGRCGETARHWLRHLLLQHGTLLERLKSRRPQDDEQWQGREHDIALLCQLADYSRALPSVSRGTGTAGSGIGDGRWRVLTDMLGAQALLQRPWPLAEQDALRSVQEYRDWAAEHLRFLARQL